MPGDAVCAIEALGGRKMSSAGAPREGATGRRSADEAKVRRGALAGDAGWLHGGALAGAVHLVRAGCGGTAPDLLAVASVGASY